LKKIKKDEGRREEKGYEFEVKTIVANLEKVLEQGASKNHVAWSLAGVNTESAEEFRRKHFSDKPSLMAASYSTDSTTYNGIICHYGYEE